MRADRGLELPAAVRLVEAGPALAAGNTCVFKPASYTPLTAIRLFELIDQAGLLPHGVINLITGPGGSVGRPMAAHPQVDKVSISAPMKPKAAGA